MEEGRKPFATLTYDKAHAEIYLGARIMALSEALHLAVDEIAKIKGTTDLAWLDDLRERSTRSAKGIVTEQVPVETEAKALRFGLQALENDFESIRRRLIKPK